MIGRMQVMTMRHVGVVSRLFMVSGCIMFGCFPVMISCVLMMFRSRLMMLNGFVMIVFAFWHRRDMRWRFKNGQDSIPAGQFNLLS